MNPLVFLLIIILLIILIIVVYTWLYKDTCGEAAPGPCNCSSDSMSATCLRSCGFQRECDCEEQKAALENNIKSVDNFISERRAEQQRGERPQWVAGGKAGSVGPGNDPIINKKAGQQQCAVIIDGIVAHENSHVDFLRRKVCSNLWNVMRSRRDESYRNRLWDESEFEAYEAQRSFMQEKLDEIKKKGCTELSPSASQNRNPNQPAEQGRRLRKAAERVSEYGNSLPNPLNR